MIRFAFRVALLLATTAGLAVVAVVPTAHADNRRFNSSVVQNVYTVQRQAGCTNDLTVSPQLLLAAEWHAKDLMGNRGLGGDIGSDGSTPQQRADNAGFRGAVAQTVAIHPALAISGIELINLWYHNPAYHAIMADCGFTKIGVWSENSLDRTVVVAVYGRPD
ncbi:CAP domain-containing protein [Mycolicibacterium litorale]|uniref:CAP domain-containing protein n=1 Tax=Mycolicibacterium litorale TaxID=758802 RepID=UPI003CF2C0FD